MTVALYVNQLSDLQNFKYSIDDIELLAKYIYVRKYEGNKPKSISFANSKKGLRECFVDESGKMKSFKYIDRFLNNHLGFSLYLSNYSFLAKYLMDIADALNSTNDISTIKSIQECLKSEGVIIKFLFKKLNKIEKPFEFHRSNIINDKFSFLYDLLCQREAIEDYHQDITDKVNLLYSRYLKCVQKRKTKTQLRIHKLKLLYCLIFIILYRFDEDFFQHWKSYYSKDDYKILFEEDKETDNKYSELQDFAQFFYDHFKLLNIKKELFSKDDNQNFKYIYPYLLLIEKITKDFLKNENAHILTLQSFFLHYTKGGQIVTNDFMFNKLFLNDTNDVRCIIDNLRCVDLTRTLMIPENRRTPLFSDKHTLPTIIFNLILKCWLYYSDARFCKRKTVIQNIHFSFSHYYFTKETYRDRPIEESEMQMFFETDFTYPNSTSNVYAQFNDYLYKKSTSKLHSNFFKAFSSYEYHFIKDVKQLKLFKDDLKSEMFNKEHYVKESLTYINKVLNTHLNKK